MSKEFSELFGKLKKGINEIAETTQDIVSKGIESAEPIVKEAVETINAVAQDAAEAINDAAEKAKKNTEKKEKYFSQRMMNCLGDPARAATKFERENPGYEVVQVLPEGKDFYVLGKLRDDA